MLKPRVSLRTQERMCRKGSRATRVVQTVMVRQMSNGVLAVPLPRSVVKLFGAKAGDRVWFGVSGDSVFITRRPWGPYPQVRRQSSKLRRLARSAGADARSCSRHRLRYCSRGTA
jgi:antitoxin component of MazEF toxin-antitoxin module